MNENAQLAPQSKTPPDVMNRSGLLCAHSKQILLHGIIVFLI